MPDHARRRRSLLSNLEENVFVAYNLENHDTATLRYLTGFTGEGLLLIHADETILLTDSRYTEQAQGETDGIRIEETRMVDAVVPVTKANFAAAETQTVFAKYVAKVAAETCTGGMGVIWNDGKTADPKDRTVIRINFDTLYSWLILDLSTPATFTLPETNGR